MKPLNVVPAREVQGVILLSLLNRNGKAVPSEVYDEVEANLPKLTRKAQKNLPYNVRWVRATLQTRGLVRSRVRGLWELTPAGLKEARNLISV